MLRKELPSLWNSRFDFHAPANIQRAGSECQGSLRAQHKSGDSKGPRLWLFSKRAGYDLTRFNSITEPARQCPYLEESSLGPQPSSGRGGDLRAEGEVQRTRRHASPPKLKAIYYHQHRGIAAIRVARQGGLISAFSVS